MSTSQFQFVPATKAQRYLRAALAGPSGSGKTVTALRMACGLAPNGTYAVIDTEHKSALDYAPIPGEAANPDQLTFDFLHLPLASFAPKDLPLAVAAATAAHADVLLIDSMSHFWSGPSGMLEQVDRATAAARSGSSFSSGWKEMRPVEREMWGALLAFPGHLIITLRTKTDWSMDPDRNGKTQPRRVGTKPEQREGVEYEFSIFGEVDLEHTLSLTKTRCPELDGAVIRKPDETLGRTLAAWLGKGTPIVKASDYAQRALLPSTDLNDLMEILESARRDEVIAGMVVDGNGNEVTLNDLLRDRWRELSAAGNGRQPAEAVA